MIYAIGENKIVRATEDGSAVAEVHFEQLRPGVYEITEVLTAGTGEDDVDLEKIMTKTADHMKKNAYRIYTRDPFAKEWFAKHREYADILTSNRSSMRRKDSEVVSSGIRYGEDDSWEHSDRVDVPRRRKSAAEAVSLNSGRRKRETSIEESASSAGPEYAEDAEDTAPARKKRLRGTAVDAAELPSAASRAVGRVIQWICGFLAAFCAFLFAASYFSGTAVISESLSSTAQGRILFQTLSAVFVIYCALLFLWTISRKRFHTQQKNLLLDVGRGLPGFLILLLFLSLTGTLQTISEHHVTVADSYAEMSMGIIGFLTVLNTFKRYIFMSGLAGCVLSMVRKYLGR